MIDNIKNIKFNKVKKIPSSLEPNSFYFVESGNYTEAFLTTQTGDLKKIGGEGTVTVYEQFEALEDQTEFTLSHLVKETNDYAVFINGLLQPEDFYQIEDNTLIFSEPLGEGDIVRLHGLMGNLWSIPRSRSSRRRPRSRSSRRRPRSRSSRRRPFCLWSTLVQNCFS